MEKVKSLFVELVKIELSRYKIKNINMLANTIQYFAEMTPFSCISIEEWYCICSANGVKYDI